MVAQKLGRCRWCGGKTQRFLRARHGDDPGGEFYNESCPTCWQLEVLVRHRPDVALKMLRNIQDGTGRNLIDIIAEGGDDDGT